ncbi:hypothetical protein C0J52_14751 [Blattella germanica]|nr:hypothetical protein C0J52_14751 [Blattella germanica]
MRSYFQVTGMSQSRPSILKIYNVKPEDEGVFRCRVDFVDSPTRNFRVNLTIVVPPSEPTIYDDKGKEITGVAGPFLEGYDLALTCLVKGGRPLPKVIWFLGTDILDQESESSSSGFTRNRLYIKVVTRSLLNEHLRCEAFSSELTDPVAKNVTIDIYRKYCQNTIILFLQWKVFGFIA